MIKGVSHVSLSVMDLDRSLSFYRDVLDLDVLAEPYDGIVFEGREAILGRGVSPSTSRSTPPLTGAVSTRDARAWTTSPSEGWGWMIELRDPDDIQLELFTTATREH